MEDTNATWCDFIKNLFHRPRDTFLKEIQSSVLTTKEALSSDQNNLIVKNQTQTNEPTPPLEGDYRASGFKSRNGRVRRNTGKRNGTRTRVFPVNEYENAAFEEDIASNSVIANRRHLVKNWRPDTQSFDYNDVEYEMSNRGEGARAQRVGHRHGRSQTTEIMYIRSPPEIVSYDEAIRSVSELDDAENRCTLGGARSQSATTRKSAISSKSKSTRQVSFNVDSVFRDGARESDDSVINHEEVKDLISVGNGRLRSASNETLRSTQLDELEEIDSDDKDMPRISVPEFVSKSLDYGLVNGPLISGLKKPIKREVTPYARPENGQVRFITRLSLPGAVDEVTQTNGTDDNNSGRDGHDDGRDGHDDGRDGQVDEIGVAKDVASSDSDSGIGRSKHVAELNLRNANLMEKKSVFTIAYDNVQPKVLPPSTAESRFDSAL